jgi:predicted nuclease with RNAse H fold
MASASLLAGCANLEWTRLREDHRVSVQKILGVDLSAEPKKTAACLIAWNRDRAEVKALISGRDKTTPLTDDDLISLMAQVRLTGIDSPFGWPVPFVRAVSDWEASWDSAPRWPTLEKNHTLRYRATDEQVTRPRRPLSVSSDLIGVTAMRCAGLLSRLEGVDRAGQRGPVIEVYPAAALVGWDLPGDGYKGSRGKENRKRLVRMLAGRIKGFLALTSEQRQICREDDNVLDALVAALVVRARLLRKTTRPSSAQLDLARMEGWIHLPTCELTDLAG